MRVGTLYTLQRCRISVKQRKMATEQGQRETRVKRDTHRGGRKRKRKEMKVGKRKRDKSHCVREKRESH